MIGGGPGPADSDPANASQWALKGYSMWTLRTAPGAGVAGPFAVDTAAYRLSGSGGWQPGYKPAALGTSLACWCRDYDTAGKTCAKAAVLGRVGNGI